MDGLGGPGNILDLAPEELGAVDRDFCGIASSQLQHLIGHVQTVSLPGGAHLPGGKKDIIPPPEPRSNTTSPSVPGASPGRRY